VNATVTGLDVNAVGVILLILGIVIVFLDLLWWHSWAAAGPWRRTVYVEGPGGAPPARPYGWWPGRRRAVVEEDVPPAGPGPGPPPP
jgi:hypothetical protein